MYEDEFWFYVVWTVKFNIKDFKLFMNAHIAVVWYSVLYWLNYKDWSKTMLGFHRCHTQGSIEYICTSSHFIWHLLIHSLKTMTTANPLLFFSVFQLIWWANIGQSMITYKGSGRSWSKGVGYVGDIGCVLNRSRPIDSTTAKFFIWPC